MSSSPPDSTPVRPRPARAIRLLRRTLRLALALAATMVLGLAALGAWFLTLDFSYPAHDQILSAVTTIPEGDPSPSETEERRSEYRFGERLNETRLQRSGASLGTIVRRGITRPTYLELRDAEGQTLAVVSQQQLQPGQLGAEEGQTDSVALRLDTPDGDSPVHLLTFLRSSVGRAEQLVAYSLEASGLMPAARLRLGYRGRGLFWTWPYSGASLATYAGDQPAELIFESAEDGIVDYFAQDSRVSFLEPPAGVLRSMLGGDKPALRFRLEVASASDLIPWTSLTGGYTIRDEIGELAAVRLEDFLFRFRSQVLYHYLVDLDGDGRLTPDDETIERVLVTRRPSPPGSGPARLEIAFLAGNTEVDDRSAFRLGEALEGLLPDACVKGFGRDTDLGYIEEARDDALALLAPTPLGFAATLGPIDLLRPAHDYTAIARAAKRPYADAMTAALGRRMREIKFASKDEARTLGPEPPLVALPARKSDPEPEEPPPGPMASTSQPLLEEPDARLLAHAETLLKEIGPSLWPGLGGKLPAVLLVGRESEWLVRHPSPPPDFEPQGHHPALAAEVHARARTFDSGIQAAFPVASVPTVVLGTPALTSMPPARWALTYVHEAFHVHQMESGEFAVTSRLAHLARGDTTGMWQLNYPFPYSDPAAGQALALLGTALDRGHGALAGARASGVDAIGVDQAVQAALGASEALAAFLSRDDIQYQRFVEWKEGTARYVELNAAHLAAAAGLLPPTPQSGAPYGEAARAIESELREALQGLGKNASTRESFYASGAALAELLDAQSSDWKARYFTPDLSLEALLLDASRQNAARAAANLPAPGPRPATTPAPMEAPSVEEIGAPSAAPPPVSSTR